MNEREGQVTTVRKRSRITRRSFMIGGATTLTVLAGGTAWGLDRYIIDHVEVDHASSLVPPKATVATPASTGTWTADSYTSDTATISITHLAKGAGENRITYLVADIRVTDATIVRAAFANDQFGRNITANTSAIASDAKAVLAINGDFCGFRKDGIVIRNGVAYRNKGARQGLAFYTDGSAALYDETTTTADKLINAGVWNTLSFGPALVQHGAILSGIDTFEIGDFGIRIGNRGSIQGNQPRTGVGIIDSNHFVMIVVNGRGSDGSRGASMIEFAQMFLDAGAKTAYNIDGGGSSTMVFQDKVINKPAWFGGKERGTSDILYVAG